MAWQTGYASLELYRTGANPADFDLEYSVDYTFRYRHDPDSGEIEAEFDSFGLIEYYPDGESFADMKTIGDVTPETRERFAREIGAVLDTEARAESQRQAREEFLNRR